jgi:hypothetical protein
MQLVCKFCVVLEKILWQTSSGSSKKEDCNVWQLIQMGFFLQPLFSLIIM